MKLMSSYNVSSHASVKRKASPFANIVSRVKAHMQFRKINDALKEVKQMREGKVKAQTLDSFLNEL